MDLVIVESPTKAKALQGFLGRGYRVLASMGHIRDLPAKQLAVDVDHGFRPTYHLNKGARKVLKRLRKGAGQASTIYLATDPDREGEAIAWHITQAMKSALRGKTVHRITFHEITKEAVEASFTVLGQLDTDMVNAQQARRILDRLVGYQASPVLWKAIIGRKGLSAGRVQTVALRLVVERDRDVEAFVPVEYWSLDAELSKDEDGIHFRARLVRIGKDKPDLKTETDAQTIIEDLEGASYRVLKASKRRRTRRSYPPYTTSTLQQDAANRLHWPAAKTMRVAQELYEGVALPDDGTMGLITYMRTDSTHVSTSAQTEARKVIARYWGEEYLPAHSPNYKSRAKVAQEAHEAIRPTSSGRTVRALREHLTSDQVGLYELIWRRFIASQMKPAVYDVTTVDVACARDNKDLPYRFRASGRELIFEGFLKVYLAEERKPPKEEGAAGQTLPPLTEGDPLTLHGLFPEQHFTKPPSHFTEASLIMELERLGIGRPSTYASIIRTILAREYVERNRKTLLATELGFVVCEFLVEQFPDLFATGFTAQMEENLDSIARGERAWVDVLRAFYGPFSEAVERAQGAAQTRPVVAPEGSSKRGKVIATGERCPACDGEIVVRQGKYGRFRACSNFPKCRWKAGVAVGTCPQCGATLVERKGKRGMFWGCARYPECRYTQNPGEGGKEAQRLARTGTIL